MDRIIADLLSYLLIEVTGRETNHREEQRIELCHQDTWWIVSLLTSVSVTLTLSMASLMTFHAVTKTLNHSTLYTAFIPVLYKSQENQDEM